MHQENRPQIITISILLLVICSFVIFITVDISQETKINLSNIKTEVLQHTLHLPGPISIPNYTIIPLANFQVTGRILSRKKYYFAKEAKLSPVDLAVGWGPMSYQHIVDQIKISQRRRWYYWRTKQYPIPKNQISRHSANMHIIPSNEIIKMKVMKVKKGQIIHFEGYLVKVIGPNWTWKSSLTRNDTGNHACEIVYVTSLEILN